MQLYTQEEDVHMICATAKSFPEGIQDAFSELEKKLPDLLERPVFGISKPNSQGVIVYKAGALEKVNDEAEKYGLEPFTMSKGLYLTEIIYDFSRNLSLIGSTFNTLLQDSRLDPASYCVEVYDAKGNVTCMVKILEQR